MPCSGLKFSRLLPLQISRSSFEAERWNPGSTKGDGKVPVDFSAKFHPETIFNVCWSFFFFLITLVQRNTCCPKRLLCILLAVAFLDIVKLKLGFKGIILPEGIPCMPSTTLGRLCWVLSSPLKHSFTGCYRIALDLCWCSWKEDQMEHSITYALKDIYSPRWNS